jgi:hypothetical protein
MEQPRYNLGFHYAYEVFLHELREQAAKANKPLPPVTELALLSEYLQKNQKKAMQEKACPVCQEEIAQAMIEGKDAFAVPEFCKDLVLKYFKQYCKGGRYHG